MWVGLVRSAELSAKQQVSLGLSSPTPAPRHLSPALRRMYKHAKFLLPAAQNGIAVTVINGCFPLSFCQEHTCCVFAMCTPLRYRSK